jgi:hypothetical protein
MQRKEESIYRILKQEDSMEEIFFFESGSRRRGVKAICHWCKNEFIKRPNQNRKHCSIKCRAASQNTEVEIVCTNCQKQFKRKRRDLRSSRHGIYFCSRPCKEFAQSLRGHCNEIRPSHYGNGCSYKNSLTDVLIAEGCVDCGEKAKWSLSLHHKDGDRSNNKIENIECVCHNHHSKRHLRFLNNEWVYNSKYITPRNILDKIGEKDHGGYVLPEAMQPPKEDAQRTSVPDKLDTGEVRQGRQVSEAP